MASAESIDMENKSVRLVRSKTICCSSGSEPCVDNLSESLLKIKKNNEKDRNSNSDSNSISNDNDGSLNKTAHMGTSTTDGKTQVAATLKRRMTEPWGPHPPPLTLKNVPDTNTDIDWEDECCDLGLGLGLKPGGLPPLPESDVVKPQYSEANTKNGSVGGTSSCIGSGNSSTPSCSRPISDHYYLCERHTTKRKWYKCLKKSDNGSSSGPGLSRKFSRQRTRSKSSVSSIEEQEDSDISILCPPFPDHSRTSDDEGTNAETFPAFADVPMGTSIRQQKMLFEHDTNEILNRSPIENGCSREIPNKVINLDPILCWRCYEEQDTEDRLRRAEQEVRILRHELDRSQKQLDTKYKAIQILQKQSQVAQCDHDTTSRKVWKMTKAMEQEINKLQFELEYRQSSLMDSQQTWAGRFDSVCQDNAALVTSLEERTEELRRVRSDKMACGRERDELLALLDVKERLKYEQTRVTGQAEDAYSEFTSNELAVLGACNCRGTCGEPCGCAYAAANLRREVIKLKEIVETQKRRRDEANTTADAYRMAFEEQLYRNKALTTKLAEITSPLLAARNNSNKRPLSVLKWLVKQLNDDIPPRRNRPIDEGKQQPTKEVTKKDKDNKSSKNNNNKSPKRDRKSEKDCESKSEASGEAGNTAESNERTLKTVDPVTAAAESSGVESLDDVAETSETTATSEATTSENVATTEEVGGSTATGSDVTTTTTTPPAGDEVDETVPENTEETEEKPDYSSDDIMAIQNEQQLIAYLLERLSEQNELLAHQRLATRMLATRTSELESRLSLHGDDLSDVTRP